MAGQLPRPWFRLGSITRPTTTTTAAPVTEQPRPAPALIRPPIIRPAPQTEPPEPNSPPQSGKLSPPANAKSPTPPPPPRPTTSLPSSPTLAPSAKKAESPSTTTFTRPVLPSSFLGNGERGASAHSSPSQKAATPASAAVLPTKPSSPPFSGTDSKAKSSVPASPSHSETRIDATMAARNSPSPAPSPTVVRQSIAAVPSPKHSPKPKAAPPSPLVLPPPQLQSVSDSKHESIPQEVERKTVVVQKMLDKPTQPDGHYSSYHRHSPSFGQNGKQEQNKQEEQGKDKAIRAKKALGSDQETNTRFITMAGENRGAFMEVVASDKNSSSSSNSRGHQIGRNNNEEGNLKNNNDPKLGDTRNSKKTMGIRNSSSLPMKAFFNSNVQGINNSILMDSSFSHHDPGIHIVFSRIPPSADEVQEGQ